MQTKRERPRNAVRDDLRRRPKIETTGNPKPLTSSCESVDTQPDGRALRVHLVCYSRAIPVAGGVASRNPRFFVTSSIFCAVDPRNGWHLATSIA